MSFYSAECGSRVRRRWFWHGSPIPPTRHSLLSPPPRRPHLRASSLRPPPPSAASSPSIYACASLLFSSLLFFSRRAVCWLLLLCLVLLRRLFYRSHNEIRRATCADSESRQTSGRNPKPSLMSPRAAAPDSAFSALVLCCCCGRGVACCAVLPAARSLCRLRSPLIRCIIGASFIGASLVDKSPPHRNAPSEARRHYCTRPLLSGFIGTRPIYLAVTTRPIYWLSLISGSAHSAMAAAALEHRMIQADTLIQDRRYRRTLTHTGRRDASGRSEQYPHTL